MAVALDFGLVQAIVAHGARSAPAAVVDPSTSPALRNAGVAVVATYIQQLSLVGLVTDPQPLFGRDGGAWIGYRLSDSGRDATESVATGGRWVTKGGGV